MTATRPGAGAASGPFLGEGARRLDEWSRLGSSLPPLEAVVEVDTGALARCLGSLPDQSNGILRLVDGRRTLLDLLRESGRPELEAMGLLASLHADGVLRVAGAGGARPAASARAGTEPGGPELSRGSGVAGGAGDAGEPAPAVGPKDVPGTPAPEGAEWFADPGEARLAALGMGAAVPADARGRGPEPLRAGQAPRWVVGAVLVLALAVFLGPEWLRRSAPAAPAAVPGVSARGEAGAASNPVRAPPALELTDPTPPVERPAPSEPSPPAAAPGAAESPAVTPEPAATPPPPAPPASAPRAGVPPNAGAVPQPGLSPAYREAMAAGEARYRAGEFEAAAGDFRRAVRARETAEAQAALARSLSDAGRPAEALASYRRALAVDPGYAPAWLGLGELALTGGDEAGARAAYERYLAIEPDGPHAAEVRAVLARLRPRAGRG